MDRSFSLSIANLLGGPPETPRSSLSETLTCGNIPKDARLMSPPRDTALPLPLLTIVKGAGDRLMLMLVPGRGQASFRPAPLMVRGLETSPKPPAWQRIMPGGLEATEFPGSPDGCVSVKSSLPAGFHCGFPESAPCSTGDKGFSAVFCKQPSDSIPPYL
jgi:hypothetical protein